MNAMEHVAFVLSNRLENNQVQPEELKKIVRTMLAAAAYVEPVSEKAAKSPQWKALEKLSEHMR